MARSFGSNLVSAGVGAAGAFLAMALTPAGQTVSNRVQNLAQSTFGLCYDSTGVTRQLRSQADGQGRVVADVNGDRVDDFLTYQIETPRLEGKLKVEIRDPCHPDKPIVSWWPKDHTTTIGYVRYWRYLDKSWQFCRQTRDQSDGGEQWACDRFRIGSQGFEGDPETTSFTRADAVGLRNRLVASLPTTR